MEQYRCTIDDFLFCADRISATNSIEGAKGCYFCTAESAAMLVEAKHSVVVTPVLPDLLKVVGCWGEPTTFLEQFPDTRGVIGRAFKTGLPQLIADIEKCEHYYPYDASVKSELAVPIIDPSRTSVQAVINVESENLNHFKTSDVIILSKLGSIMLRRREHLSALKTSIERSDYLFEILNEIPDEVMLIDKSFRPVWANKAKRSNPKLRELDRFLEMKGNKGPETIFTIKQLSRPKKKDTCSWLVEGRDNRCPHCVCYMAMDSREAVTGVLYRPEKPDIVVELSASPLFAPNGTLVGCVEVARLMTQREKVTSLLKTLLIGFSEEQILESAIESLHSDLGYDRVRLYFIDEKKKTFCGINYMGDHPKLNKKDFLEKSIPIADELMSISLKGDKGGLVDYGKHSKMEEAHAYWRITIPRNYVKARIDPDGRLELDKVKEVVCVPVVSNGRRWIFFVDNKIKGRIFSYEDLQALTLFSKLTCAALENIRHNKLRFLMAMIGETSAGLAHEIDSIISAERFEMEIYPRLIATLEVAQDYFQQQPTQKMNEFLSKCLGALSSQFSPMDSMPTGRDIRNFINTMKSELEANSVKLAPGILAELSLLFYFLGESPKSLGKFLKKVSNSRLTDLIAGMVKFFLAIEHQRSVSERLHVYVKALRTAFATGKAKRLIPEYIPDIRRLLIPALDIAKKKAVGVEIDDSGCMGVKPLPVKVITGQVFFAWLALLDNAIKAARFEGKSALVRVVVTEENGECHVSVLNNGKRVPSEKISHLGKEPFSTEGGTGLGLMFVYDWIEKYNCGEVYHDYDEKLGMTIFTTKLPLVSASPTMYPADNIPPREEIV